MDIVLDSGEARQVRVAGYDVKCGAENGDIVEFVIGDDEQFGRSAKKVKLVEKGLPENGDDQIQAQATLKRNLELSAGQSTSYSHGFKRMKTEDIVDVQTEFSFHGDYSDIVDAGDLSVEAEANDGSDIEELLADDECICDQKLLVRCRFCPFYFVEAKSDHALVEGETLTLLAKIHGNEGEFKKELLAVRQVPYPFRYLKQNNFELIREIGRNSLVARLTPVFHEDHVFATIQNNTKGQVSVKSGDVLGICQMEKVSQSEAKEQNKAQDKVEIFCKRGDLSPSGKVLFCGFGSLGGDVGHDFRNALMKISLIPSLERKFKIVRKRSTVQAKNKIWLEIEARMVGYELDKNIPQGGCIATACEMDNNAVKRILSKNKTVLKEIKGKELNESPQIENSKLDQNSYEEMLSQIDQDMQISQPRLKSLRPAVNILDRTFRGVVRENLLIINPKSELETNLVIDDEESNNPAELKLLLQRCVKVTNNEEFQYYNNCYTIPEQKVMVETDTCNESRTTQYHVRQQIFH